MFVTTTMEIEGYRIIEYKGIARGLVIRSPSVVQGIVSRFKNIFTETIGSYLLWCEQTRLQAYELMIEQAAQMGANAIVGMHYDSSEVAGRLSATEVLCYGTAVVVAK